MQWRIDMTHSLRREVPAEELDRPRFFPRQIERQE
jgi:hypothetical protein